MKNNDIHKYIDSKKSNGVKVTEYISPLDIESIKSSLRIHVGEGSAPIMISKDEAFLELGAPSKQSIAFVVQLPKKENIKNGRITLIGPEMSELKGQSISFAQIIIVAGETDEKLHKRVERAQYIGDQIEGYMIRSVSHRIWSRISFEVMDKQFSFKDLGMALILIYLKSFSHIKAMEIVFVTSSDEDIKELKPLMIESQKISTEKFQQIKKRYDCDYEWDCDICDYTDICDEILNMVKRRKEFEKRKAIRDIELGKIDN